MSIDPSKIQDLHRPYIDDVEITTKSGKKARRIAEVFDCWFESGSMPYAQDHYPFENTENWDKRFPADFIAEAIDQTRGWFYTLHVLATALFDKPAFKNVICSGWVVAADGEKLSKRKKNYAPMDEVFDQFGVDTLRFFMASSPIVNGEDVRFSTDYLRDVQRKVFMTLNNIFSFYKLYADVDGWKPKKPLEEPKSTNLLDQWMISRLNETIGEITKAMENYRLDKATRPLNDLLDDTSNWFVRRSRRRFWKSEDDTDKEQAYETLHYTLLRTCQLLAPFAPFLTDHIWRELVQGTELPTSVHTSDWPKAGKVSKEILQDMSGARFYINEGLSQRAEAKIKVRQPLQRAKITGSNWIENKELKNIIADELNVKEVIFEEPSKLSGKESFKEVIQRPSSVHPAKIEVDTNVTPALKREGLMRDVVRLVQNARKQAGLEVDDRINLGLFTKDKDLEKAINEFEGTIQSETLALSLNDNQPTAFETEVKIEGLKLKITLSKAK